MLKSRASTHGQRGHYQGEVFAMPGIRLPIGLGVMASMLSAAQVVMPSHAFAQNIPNPSCAKAGSDFACVAPLDGNAIQQIIIGNWGQQTGTGGFVFIIENTGAVRRKICWNQNGGCPAVVVQ
jgi:hypothetical protein